MMNPSLMGISPEPPVGRNGPNADPNAFKTEYQTLDVEDPPLDLKS